MKKIIGITAVAAFAWAGVGAVAPQGGAGSGKNFEGRYFSGAGDVEYLELLDISRRMYGADPEFQNMAMLYQPSWNGLVEGPTWGAWWVQNSYGTTFCALPFYEEPFVGFLQNAQNLWFEKMGDGKTSYVWNGKDSWVPPDGCLMDCANETWAMHRQGDGRVLSHDWGMEFTAAGALLQTELLLISRDKAAIEHFRPKLERCANFIETRRNPTNNLFLAGAAGNLLAPSYAGSKKADGTYGMGYLTGLSVTYIAFLDRMVELEKLAGRKDLAELHAARRASARKGLDQMATEEGYFIKYQDPDGTRHGVYGAEKHGYFEASPNHDAICYGIVDEGQSRKIYNKMASIPGLRPYGLIIANAPSLDDMYEAPQGLWGFGTWVNGGHWTTCEARMMMAYSRVGQYEDARRSMKQMMTFARQFRMDNPLVKFGSEVYQPREPINITYDAFGAPAGMIRGLFEYVYKADGLTLVPHIPPGISRLEQKFPIRFGSKRLYLSISGHGPISKVRVNGKNWALFEAGSVSLPYARIPASATIQILCGTGDGKAFKAGGKPASAWTLPEVAGFNDWPVAGPAAVITSNALPVRIGADSDGGSRFQGDIARVRVYGRALTEEEVAALSSPGAGTPASDPALRGNWMLQPSADGTYANAAGRLPGAKEFGTVAIVETPFGRGLHLGGDGYLEVPDSAGLDLKGGATLYVLVRPESTKGRLIDKCPVGGATGFTFDTHPGNALRLITDSGTVSHEAKLVPGAWVHLAATVDGLGNSALFVNGKKVASGKQTAAPADPRALLPRVEQARRFHQGLAKAGLGESSEAAHARLVVQCYVAAHERAGLVANGRIARLPGASQAAADALYLNTVARLCDGLDKVMLGNAASKEPGKVRIHRLWLAGTQKK